MPAISLQVTTLSPAALQVGAAPGVHSLPPFDELDVDEVVSRGHISSYESTLARSSQLFASRHDICASVRLLPQSVAQLCETWPAGAWHEIIFD
ncbi:MAG: hypothetical protein WBV82_24260 [Myxococcaceae bacterium]